MDHHEYESSPPHPADYDSPVLPTGMTFDACAAETFKYDSSGLTVKPVEPHLQRTNIVYDTGRVADEPIIMERPRKSEAP